jgi:hypothetical protein
VQQVIAAPGVASRSRVSTLAIERLWLHIIAYRIWRRIEEQKQMARMRELEKAE